MDVAWFNARKRQLKITDNVIGDAIGRDRSIANRIINGDIPFDVKHVEGLARVFQVDRTEILRRAGVLSGDETKQDRDESRSQETNVRLVRMEGAPTERPRYDLPVYGTALGSAREVEGEAIEQTELNRGDVAYRVKRPSILSDGSDAYALHVQGSSMHPALRDGDLIVASPRMALAIGDNVVVYLRTNNHEEDNGKTARAVLVKELVRRSASFVELRQYQPQKDFRIPMSDVIRIDHVLTRKEMLS